VLLVLEATKRAVVCWQCYSDLGLALIVNLRCLCQCRHSGWHRMVPQNYNYVDVVHLIVISQYLRSISSVLLLLKLQIFLPCAYQMRNSTPRCTLSAPVVCCFQPLDCNRHIVGKHLCSNMVSIRCLNNPC